MSFISLQTTYLGDKITATITSKCLTSCRRDSPFLKLILQLIRTAIIGNVGREDEETLVCN